MGEITQLIKRKLYGKIGWLDLPSESMPIMTEPRSEMLFVHIHLPKTGGTTFNTVLQNNFEESYEPFEGRFIHFYPKITNNQLLKFIKRHPGIQAMSSHNFTSIVPYKNSIKSIVSIAFIRDPVDRFFSLYFHLRHYYGVDYIEQKMKLDEYIDFKLSNRKYYPQAYLSELVGQDNSNAFEYIANLVTSRNLYLFPTYKMENSLKILGLRFPEYFKDLRFNKKNISKKDQLIEDEMKIKVHGMISDFDWKLLELANKILEESE